MGKMKTTRKRSARKKTPAPSSLTLRLHAPGMTLLHRAGLGGLAATLKAMERRHKLGRLRDEQLPLGPDLGNRYPWRVEPTSITLDWGEPTAAGEYLRELFAFAFGIKDKLIDLPGTYRDELSRAVRAELQHGLMLTFLQHGGTRTVGDPSVQFVNPTSDGLSQVAFDWRPCAYYKHQDGANKLTTSAGTLKQTVLKIEGPLYPGAAERHSEPKLSHRTKVEEPPERAIPLYFAMIGCLSLPIRRSVGVLLVPSVTDLAMFARARPRMTPTSSRECRIAGLGDAALQAMVRLRGTRMISRHGKSTIGHMYGMRLAPQAWDKKQKYRDATIDFLPLRDDAAEDRRLRRFELALSHLPRSVSPHEWDREHEVGRGRDAKNKRKVVKIKTSEHIWYDSVVRPLAADNLSRGRRWYDGFARLVGNREMTRRVGYETKGLRAMADEPELLDDEEMEFIRALHHAIAIGLGRIYAEMGRPPKGPNGRYPVGLTNRWDRFRERVRLALIGAKTRSQTQEAISVVLARAGIPAELRDAQALRRLKDLVFGDDWRRVRDLALFALASYKKPADMKELPADTEGFEESEAETQPSPETEE